MYVFSSYSLSRIIRQIRQKCMLFTADAFIEGTNNKQVN